jgi:large subunit ribosomal protein L16
MQIPKSVKYKKLQKVNIGKKIKFKSYKLSYGVCGLKSKENGKLTLQQLTEIRFKMLRKLKKSGKFFLKTSPNCPCTRKSQGSRMGKGKGNVDFNSWSIIVKRGFILFEVSNIDSFKAQLFLQEISVFLPFKTSLVV